MRRVIEIGIANEGNNATLTSSTVHSAMVRVGSTFKYTLNSVVRAVVQVHIDQVVPTVIKYGLSSDDTLTLPNSFLSLDNTPLTLHMTSRQTLWLRSALDTHVRLVIIGEES